MQSYASDERIVNMSLPVRLSNPLPGKAATSRWLLPIHASFGVRYASAAHGKLPVAGSRPAISAAASGSRGPWRAVLLRQGDVYSLKLQNASFLVHNASRQGLLRCSSLNHVANETPDAVDASPLLQPDANGLSEGRLRVRPVVNSDGPEIIRLQSSEFYYGSTVPFLDGLSYKLFVAEVADGFKQKLRSVEGQEFNVFVVEDVSAMSNDANCVGVVDVALLRDRPTRSELPVTCDAYAYVSSMVVQPSRRRQGAATLLLSAVEVQTRLWGVKDVVLHVYRDNDAAVALYAANGFQVVACDPEWKRFLGGRVRLLMHKRLYGAALQDVSLPITGVP